MATKRKKNTDPVDPALEKLYFFHIWKDRASWTGHAIPIRTVDPRTGFFVEGYIQAPAQIKDPNDQDTQVQLAFMPIYSVSEFYVSIKDVYPTKRKITRIKDNNIISDPTDSSFDPTYSISTSKLSEIFLQYKDLSFTIKELEFMLNNKLTEENKKSLVQVGEKHCIFSTELQPAFQMQKSVTVAENLSQLYDIYKNCNNCQLGIARIARNIDEPTFGRCNTTKMQDIKSNTIKLMIIGEAPGVQEEEFHMPFYPEAPAGGVLSKVLHAAKIDLETVYFTNSVLCRPAAPNDNTQNGKPSVDDIKACNPRLKNEIAIIRPKVVLLLGRYAYKAFYGTEPKSVLDMTGWQNDEKSVYFAPHPSFVLRELNYAKNEEHIASIKNTYLSNFLDVKSAL
jgi:uracil-DNA glycosylase family 4